MKSDKSNVTHLGQTLAELEKALNTWDQIKGEAPTTPEKPAPPATPATEWRQRTQELLSKLRQQISELSD